METVSNELCCWIAGSTAYQLIPVYDYDPRKSRNIHTTKTRLIQYLHNQQQTVGNVCANVCVPTKRDMRQQQPEEQQQQKQQQHPVQQSNEGKEVVKHKTSIQLYDNLLIHIKCFSFPAVCWMQRCKCTWGEDARTKAQTAMIGSRTTESRWTKNKKQEMRFKSNISISHFIKNTPAVRCRTSHIICVCFII